MGGAGKEVGQGERCGGVDGDSPSVPPCCFPLHLRRRNTDTNDWTDDQFDLIHRVSVVKVVGGEVEGLDLLGQVERLELSFIDNSLSDLSLISNIQSVRLLHCEGITDVSPFRHTQHLSINRCRTITDFSMLGGVNKRLSIRHSEHVTDVSPFKDIFSLSLTWCHGVTNVTTLSNVHTLNLSSTSVSEVSCLGLVHTLSLSNCCNVVRVDGLNGVHTLSLWGCNQVADVNCLDGVFDLDVS